MGPTVQGGQWKRRTEKTESRPRRTNDGTLVQTAGTDEAKEGPLTLEAWGVRYYL